MDSRRPPKRFGRFPATVALILLFAFGSSSVLFITPTTHANSVDSGAAAASGGYSNSVMSGQPEKVAGAVAPAATEVNLGTTFAGVHYGSNGAVYDSYSPPDVQLATGPTEVVEMVNVHEEIFTKAGASIQIVPLSAVFNVPSSEDIGDPRIVYDNASGRFYASVFDFSTQGVQVAVSKSSQAENGWYVYSIPNYLSGVCVDQPFIGVSSDKVVVTGNDYYSVGPSTSPCRPLNGGFAYQEVWVINKAELSSGGNTHWNYYYWGSASGYFGMRPVSSPTSTAYIVCTTCNVGILLERVTGVPSASTNPTMTPSIVPFAPPPAPPSAPHLGNTDLIDTDGDIRIWSTAWSNGIWIAMNDACVPAGDSTSRSCVRLVQISLTINQYITNTDVYGPPGYYLYYPAIAVDSFGSLGLVSGYSSSSTYPSLLVTGVRNGESFGALESNQVIVAAGTGYYCHYYRSSNICRYGDYSGGSSDPADPATMWFAGEYETSNGWATAVSSVKMGLAAVTLSYSTQDGSSSPQAPTVSYTQGGAGMVGTLSSSPTTFYMDLGTSWSAGSQLGGTVSQRWGSSSSPGAQVSGDTSSVVLYYHQYLITPTYSVSGGGTGYTSPGVTCTQFGSAVSATSGSSVWADAKSSCAYAQTLPGSKTTERWAPASSSVAVSASGSISQTYYHQFLFTLNYTVKGGGVPNAPSFASVQFGNPNSPAFLTSSPTGYWLDSGTPWRIDALLGGSTGSERWLTSGITFGAATGPLMEALTYQHQYYVSVVVSPSQGGTQGFINGWYSAGTTVILSATKSSGWQFEGWSGIGSGAFSGSSPYASFSLNGPTNETALFYPGITITATGSGSVQYSFGSTKGTVSGGGNATVYTPAGTTITLTPSSSSFLYSFGGWGGALTGGSTPGQLQLNAPSSVSASFGLNFTVIGGLAAVAAFVILGLVFYLRRRPGSGATSMAPTSPPTAAKAQSKFCPNCGSPVSLQATFCNQCGAKLS